MLMVNPLQEEVRSPLRKVERIGSVIYDGLVAYIPSHSADDEILLSGVQHNTRSTTATYNDFRDGLRKVASIDEVVFERDTDGVVRRRVEDSATNLNLQSSDLTAASWGKSGMAGTTVDTLTESNTNAIHRALHGAMTTTSGVAVTESVEIGLGTRRYCILAITNGLNGFWAVIDNVSKTITQTGGAGIGVIIGATLIENLDGFLEVTLTGTLAATNYYVTLEGSLTGTPSGFALPYVGDGSTIIARRFQFEIGGTGTSHIPTTTAPISRAADIQYIDNANIPSLANGATFLCEGALPDDGAYHALFRASPRHTFIHRRATGEFEAWIGGMQLPVVTGVDANIHKFAIRTNGTNLHEALIDGVVVSTSITAGILQPFSRLYQGSSAGASDFQNGLQSDLKIYNRRLTDSELAR